VVRTVFAWLFVALLIALIPVAFATRLVEMAVCAMVGLAVVGVVVAGFTHPAHGTFVLALFWLFVWLFDLKRRVRAAIVAAARGYVSWVRLLLWLK
jgi:hypothetical protein